MVIQQKINAAQFWEISQRSENRDRDIELVQGEIIEVSSNLLSSKIAGRILGFIFIYLQAHDIGHLTGADGGYDMDDENTFAPDVGFISYKNQPEVSYHGFNPIPPDLAIEVVSPSDLKDPKRRITKKLEKYQELRVPLVWYVYTERQEVEVYRPDQPPQTVGMDGVLDGGDVLPGFSLSVKDIFK